MREIVSRAAGRLVTFDDEAAGTIAQDSLAGRAEDVELHSFSQGETVCRLVGASRR